MSAFLGRVLEIAAGEVGVREVGGANRGPRVKEYLRSIGLDEGHPWCAAFLFWCWEQAARDCSVHNPMPRTGKVATLWRRAALQRTPHPFPGAVFVHLTDPADPASKGHCGIVESVAGTHVVAIEGNTNEHGSREGVMVRRQMRPTLGSPYITGWLNLDIVAGPEDPTVRVR